MGSPDCLLLGKPGRTSHQSDLTELKTPAGNFKIAECSSVPSCCLFASDPQSGSVVKLHLSDMIVVTNSKKDKLKMKKTPVPTTQTVATLQFHYSIHFFFFTLIIPHGAILLWSWWARKIIIHKLGEQYNKYNTTNKTSKVLTIVIAINIKQL